MSRDLQDVPPCKGARSSRFLNRATSEIALDLSAALAELALLHSAFGSQHKKEMLLQVQRRPKGFSEC